MPTRPEPPRTSTHAHSAFFPSHPSLAQALLPFWPAFSFVLGLGKYKQGGAANFSLENNFPQLFVNFCHSKG